MIFLLLGITLVMFGAVIIDSIKKDYERGIFVNSAPMFAFLISLSVLAISFGLSLIIISGGMF